MTPPTFKCGACGGEAYIEPPEGSAVCPGCCEDHDYRYDRGECEHRCIHCDEVAPGDWYLQEDDV